VSQSFYSFNLPIKAFSINKYHYATKKIKTSDARAWEGVVLEHLHKHPDLLKMADKWRISGGVFHITITINYPRQFYYNSFGRISAKTFDVTNTEKPLVDLIMNTYMKVDDRNLTVCTSSKGPVEGPNSIDITLELLQSEERNK